MKKDQIIILKERGLISVSGHDAKDFLQNILTNDVDKVDKLNSIFSAILTPQGKYLYDFFVIKSFDGYILDCASEFTKEILEHLAKYKLRSKIEIQDLSSNYVVGIINFDKFKEIQLLINKKAETIEFRECPIFIDPRASELGARILSDLDKLHLIIKKLNLKIVNDKDYLSRAHLLNIPVVGTKNLQSQLFGLEANFEELNAIDFKKGCYVGQENTARMKLKNKIRRRLLSVKTDEKLKIGSELIYNNIKIGKILIDTPYPFALVRLHDPDLSSFQNKEILIENKTIKIINIF